MVPGRLEAHATTYVCRVVRQQSYLVNYGHSHCCEVFQKIICTQLQGGREGLKNTAFHSVIIRGGPLQTRRHQTDSGPGKTLEDVLFWKPAQPGNLEKKLDDGVTWERHRT